MTGNNVTQLPVTCDEKMGKGNRVEQGQGEGSGKWSHISCMNIDVVICNKDISSMCF